VQKLRFRMQAVGDGSVFDRHQIACFQFGNDGLNESHHTAQDKKNWHRNNGNEM
jgi:hypothetical protein